MGKDTQDEEGEISPKRRSNEGEGEKRAAVGPDRHRELGCTYGEKDESSCFRVEGSIAA